MILLIGGIPGSGKSSFGKYLSDKHSFFYLPMENDIWPDEKLHSLWNQKIYEADKGIYDFIEIVKNENQKIILDWGFVPEGFHLHLVQLLKKYGCRIIWFDCEEVKARERFSKREKRVISPLTESEPFNIQMKRISNNWNKIIKELQPEIINVLKKDKSSKSKEEIYKEIFH